MNNFGIDTRSQMLLARQHEAELRDAWKSANSRSLVREEAQEPCTEQRYDWFARMAGRLMANLQRRPMVAATEPCSQDVTA